VYTLEFSPPKSACISSNSYTSMGAAVPNYFDSRDWTTWSKPVRAISGYSTNAILEVLEEMKNCTTAFPTAYVRLVAFDEVVWKEQVMSFLVQRPKNSADWQVAMEKEAERRRVSSGAIDTKVRREVAITAGAIEWIETVWRKDFRLITDEKSSELLWLLPPLEPGSITMFRYQEFSVRCTKESDGS
jgi:ribulose bisphosphate carboxylase small subunit